jgi:hypothetical protein
LAPQPSVGLGLPLKIRLNFLEASQQFSFLQGRIVAPRPTPIPEDQASEFIPPERTNTRHNGTISQSSFTKKYGKMTDNEVAYLAFKFEREI